MKVGGYVPTWAAEGQASICKALDGFSGSITAALFLRRFADHPRYIHFDIYGHTPSDAPARPKGGPQTRPRLASRYWTTRTSPSVLRMSSMGRAFRPRFSLASHLRKSTWFKGVTRQLVLSVAIG